MSMRSRIVALVLLMTCLLISFASAEEECVRVFKVVQTMLVYGSVYLLVNALVLIAFHRMGIKNPMRTLKRFVTGVSALLIGVMVI